MRHRESETASQSQTLLGQVTRYSVRMSETVETLESGTHCNGGGARWGARQFVAEM